MSKTPTFARRTAWSLSANRINGALERLKRDKVSVLDLTQSNPTRCGFSYPADEITSPLVNDTNIRYEPDPKGMSMARQTVSRYYADKGLSVDRDRVFLTASTSEAYTYLFRLLADPGDRILFPRPSYPLFAFLGDINDLDIKTYPLNYHQGWRMDMESIKRELTANTKAIVVVNPNNPTGSFVKAGEFGHLTDLSSRHGLALISDEVFADYPFQGPKSHVSLAGHDRVLNFTLGGISKALGLPQMKLSWIAVNGPDEQVIDAAGRLEIIADTYLSVNTPVQNAFKDWMDFKARIQAEILKRITSNRAFLQERLATAAPCALLDADGGWYAVIKLPDGIDEEEFTLAMLNEDHVLVHPGYFFDFDMEPIIVVSLLPCEDIFDQGVERITARIKHAGRKSRYSGQIY